MPSLGCLGQHTGRTGDYPLRGIWNFDYEYIVVDLFAKFSGKGEEVDKVQIQTASCGLIAEAVIVQ